ncbi:MAG: FAD:protein FMN transferase, partial [Gemmatimonadetes bacterium]|nr:FAD:protein FMN transferase [Gemmatimonadota bacterium]
STYRENSELSRFNRAPGGAWFPVSSETAEVVARARAIHEASGGAFDPTVGPLVDLWGFGPPERPVALPDSAAIAGALALVGMDKVEVRGEPPALRKTSDAIRLDLSAIAKGYGVDLIGRLLEERGLGDYFIEIGGEIVLGGERVGGKPWRLAVESPRAEEREVERVIEARGPLGIASSGTYRNYFDREGNRYSHTIDPRTGRPVTHHTAGVSVLATTCMDADGWATALLVLGGGEALALADREQVAAIVLPEPALDRTLDVSESKAYLLYKENGRIRELP